MPNARDVQQVGNPRILALGDTGSGKTSSFLSLPGKKFAYLFDPNATLTLKGYDVEYEEFLPDELALNLTSLSKKVRDQKSETRPKQDAAKAGADLYHRWQDDFEQRYKNGFFSEYDWIGIDSFTTFQDMVMDGILSINGRAGQFPQEDDYPAQMTVLSNVIRTLVGMGIGVYVCGHNELKQDSVTHKLVKQPLMTGRLRTKLPLLFSEILQFEATADMNGNVSYVCQTKPDRQNVLVRTSMKGVDYKEDVSLDFSKDLEGQGLATLLRKGGILPS